MEYINKVEERGPVLLITLTMGKIAIADNDESVKEILKKYRFSTIKRKLSDGLDAFYAVSVSAITGRNYLHRLVLGLDTVAGRNVYHKDGNPLNCCRSNLEVKRTKDLLIDAKRLRNPVVGVSKNKKGWIAVWIDKEGDRHYKLFSFKYNEPGRAYELAVNHRVSMHAGCLWSREKIQQ